MSQPNKDPALRSRRSASTAALGTRARLVVPTGTDLRLRHVMDTIEEAVPDSGRQRLIVAARRWLAPCSDSTPNPHLWYDPRRRWPNGRHRDRHRTTSADDPADHAAYFKRQTPQTFTELPAKAWINALERGDHSSKQVPRNHQWTQRTRTRLRASRHRPPTTRTTWAFKAEVMNGRPVGAQDVAIRAEAVHPAQGQGVFYNHQQVDGLA